MRAGLGKVTAALILVLALCGACTRGVMAVETAPQLLTEATIADAMIADDGARIALNAWLPDGPPRAVVIAVHGMNDYGRAFEQPAAGWTRVGLAVYAPDLRGFGRSLERGRWYGGPRMAGDLLTLARLLRDRHPGTPVHLLGESMGGAVAVLAAARAEPGLFASLVLSAPAVWGEGWRMGLTYGAAQAMGRVVPGVTVGRRSYDNPSTDDPATLKRLREDPLILHRTRFDTLAGIIRLMRTARQEAGRVRLPTLLMLGDLDGHVPRDGVAALARRLPADTRLALYPKGRHLLLRSLGGDAVAADVAAWLDDRARPLPSGADARARACAWLILQPERGCRMGYNVGMP